MTRKMSCGKKHLSHEKNPPTFHYTGWLIGILIMVYYNPYIPGQYNLLYTLNNQGPFFHCSLITLNLLNPFDVITPLEGKHGSPENGGPLEREKHRPKSPIFGFHVCFPGSILPTINPNLTELQSFLTAHHLSTSCTIIREILQNCHISVLFDPLQNSGQFIINP